MIFEFLRWVSSRFSHCKMVDLSNSRKLDGFYTCFIVKKSKINLLISPKVEEVAEIREQISWFYRFYPNIVPFPLHFLEVIGLFCPPVIMLCYENKMIKFCDFFFFNKNKISGCSKGIWAPKDLREEAKR